MLDSKCGYMIHYPINLKELFSLSSDKIHQKWFSDIAVSDIRHHKMIYLLGESLEDCIDPTLPRIMSTTSSGSKDSRWWGLKEWKEELGEARPFVANAHEW